MAAIPREYISIIIPTYNEDKYLPLLLKKLSEVDNVECVKEIIVSDGKSTDNTISVANKFWIRVIVNGQPGRARQMNAGAKMATGQILYFLHADSTPPAGFIRQILAAHASGTVAGCFRLRFDWSHWFLKLNAWFTRFNINAFRFGDQSLFITKDLFNMIGGFREDYILMEDQEIVYRIARHTRFRVLPDYITTSARKYRVNGAFRMQAIFFYIYCVYFLGASQQTLKSIYQKLIQTP